MACGSDGGAELAGEGNAGPIPAWERVPDSPLDARDGAVIVWTGDEILVVGGTTFVCPPNAGCSGPVDPPLSDGAAFDPESGTWRSIPDAPVPVPSYSRVATLGGDVYVLAPDWRAESTHGPNVLRYRSETDSWDVLERPEADSIGGIAATDAAIIVYPISDNAGHAPDYRFDPIDESWAMLPNDPLSPASGRHYVWNHDGLHLFAKAMPPSSGGDDEPSFVQAAVLDDGQWTELPTADSFAFRSPIVDDNRIVSPTLGCVDGGEVNNYGRCISLGAVFDSQSKAWTELPNEPHPGKKDVFSSGAMSDEEVSLTSLGHPMLDLVTDTWFTVPTIPGDSETEGMVHRNVAGAGPHGFAFGGAVFGPDAPGGALIEDAWIWRVSDRDDGP